MLTTDARIYFYLRGRGYSHGVAEWMIKQSIQETRFAGSNWNSPAARNDNNLWGMGRVYSRPTTQINSRMAQDGSGVNTIGIYATQHSSTVDRVLFDKWYIPRYVAYAAERGVAITERQLKKDPKEYAVYVDWTPYNASPDYVGDVKAIRYTAEKFRIWVSVALVGVTATVLYILWKRRKKKI